MAVTIPPQVIGGPVAHPPETIDKFGHDLTPDEKMERMRHALHQTRDELAEVRAMLRLLRDHVHGERGMTVRFEAAEMEIGMGRQVNAADDGWF